MKILQDISQPDHVYYLNACPISFLADLVFVQFVQPATLVTHTLATALEVPAPGDSIHAEVIEFQTLAKCLGTRSTSWST